MNRWQRQAFTLVEVALAMAILTVGLTAVTTVYLTALRWAAETRSDLAVYDVAKQVVIDPSLLCNDTAGRQPAGFRINDEMAKGWYRNLYVVRERLGEDPIVIPGIDDPVGSEHLLQITVYAGGTDADGEQVTTVRTRKLVWND